MSSWTIRLAREANGAWRRVVIEKPFGTDLNSARALNQKLLGVLNEHQIFRIDHYLGKETVQNIMVLRFANGLFEPIWNRDHIDHVQITVAELLTVGRRGSYYDATGALRDMVPNHLAQLLSLVAMEPPSRFAAAAVRAEKAQVLDAVQLQNAEEALRNSVRAQYDDGYIEIAPSRPTQDRGRQTRQHHRNYVALKLTIDNWRSAGVPFYLRTGKALRASRPRWRSSSSRRRSRCSAIRRSSGWRKISWSSGFSRTKASASNSTPRFRGLRSPSAASP